MKITAEQELEKLDELYVANNPVLTHINIATRINHLFNVIYPTVDKNLNRLKKEKN